MQQMLTSAMTLSRKQIIFKPNKVTWNVWNQKMIRLNASFVKKLKSSVCQRSFEFVNVFNMNDFQNEFFISASQSEVVVRTCHWETENAHRNDCHDEIIKSNGTILFCETCDTDGCNTASMQNQPIVKLILSIFIVKSLMDLFCNKTQWKMGVRHKQINRKHMMQITVEANKFARLCLIKTVLRMKCSLSIKSNSVSDLQPFIHS